MSVSLESLVQEWLRLDKVTSFLEPYNRSTRADIQALWDEGNTEELESRMRWIARHFPSFVMATLHSLAGRALSSVLLVCSRVVAVLQLQFADISRSSRGPGLRGKMEAGWSRMNDLIIIQASQVRWVVDFYSYYPRPFALKGTLLICPR
jgi:hypothetical protein